MGRCCFYGSTVIYIAGAGDSEPPLSARYGLKVMALRRFTDSRGTCRADNESAGNGETQ